MTNGGRSTEAEIAVFIGLGSNLGDRESNLREAIERIKKLGVEVVSSSSIYETEPVGFADQPWFLNKVIETRLPDVSASKHEKVLADPESILSIQAEALLSELLKIEHGMGRERTIVDGPRVIDIDLLLFGDRIIGHSKEDAARSSIDRSYLVVPHPRMHLRRFVLEPLCEIAPEIMHPVLRQTCRELLASLGDDSTVTLHTSR